MILLDAAAATELPRIESLIEEYRDRKRRQLLRSARSCGGAADWLLSRFAQSPSDENVRGGIVLSNMNRARVMQAWFAAVVLVVIAAGAFGAQVNVGFTGALLTLGLVPPLIVFRLWPEPQPLAAAEVIRGTDSPCVFRMSALGTCAGMDQDAA